MGGVRVKERDLVDAQGFEETTTTLMSGCGPTRTSGDVRFCAGVKNIADIKCALIAARQTYCRMSPSLVLPTKWAKKVAITGRGFRMLIAPAFSRGEAARLLKTFEEGRRLCFVVEPSHQGDAL
jgi:hypothetical protein